MWPAVPASVPAARRAVTVYLNAVEAGDPPTSDIALALSEAVSNAVLHAYVDRPCGDVRVSVGMTEAEVAVVIEDDGRGMRPRPDSPGLGLGLPVIAMLAERTDTRSTPGQGTRVTAWFLRSPAAATLPA